MEKEELIDNLAFGISAPKRSRALGLFISPEKIYISQTHVDNNRVILDQLFKIALPHVVPPASVSPGASQMPGSELLGDINKIADAINPVIGKLVNASQDVVITLSPQLSFLRYFQMPAINQKFWDTAIPLEAKKYIPFPFNGLLYDFQVIPSAPLSEGHAGQGVLITVAAKSMESFSRELAGKLKLKLSALEIGPASYLRFLYALDKDIHERLCLWVHLDNSHARVIISNKGIPLFFREADLRSSGGNWDSRQLGLSGCMDFVSHKLGLGSIQKFFLSGVAAGGPIVTALSQEIGLDADLRNPAASLGLKSGDWESCSAIGGSIRYLSSSPVTLDLSSSQRVTPGERRAARFIFFIAGFFSALFLALGVWDGVDSFLKAQELSRLRRDTQIESLFRGKNSTQIKKMIATLEKKTALIGGTSVAGGSLSELLKDISDTIPDNVWITEIHFVNPLQTKNSSQGTTAKIKMTLSGHVVADSQMDEQDLARQFKEALSRAPTFRKVFHNVEISLEAKEQMAPTFNQANSLSGAGSQNKARTTFTITASSNI